MFDPNKIKPPSPRNESQPDPELTARFAKKLEDEASLGFMTRLFEELPEPEFYLVGGMVRDTIIKHPTSKDYDFIARGVPMKKLVAVLQKMGQVDFVGRNFGVIKFTPEGSTLREPIDIALPRTEIAQGTGGYRDVEAKSDHTLNIEDDLSRRDLTINAIAWDTRKQKLIDPFNGQHDLRDEIIRCVGRPEDRFQEDYSRMLRAIRFACRFGFDIEENTWRAIQNLMPKINDQREITIVEALERQLALATKEAEIQKLKQKIEKQKQTDPRATKLEYIVPRETIGIELLKSLKENPARALLLLEECGALERLLPETLKMKGCEQSPEHHAEGDVWTHTLLMLEKIKSKEFREHFPHVHLTGEFVLGVLLHDIGKPLTRQTKEAGGAEKITFYGHDKESAKIAGSIADRLSLSEDQTARLKFMASNHMFAMTVENIFAVRVNKFTRRFLDSPYSPDLLMLFYLDAACTIRPDGSSPMQNFYDTLKRIEEIKKIRANQPEKIIDGSMIMSALGLKGGPFIGCLLLAMKELTDSGKINNEAEALTLLREQKDAILRFESKVTRDNREELAEEIAKLLSAR